MANLVFPRVSVKPSGTFTQKKSEATKAANLVTPTDAGYDLTRRRFTRITDTFGFYYWPLGDEDYRRLKLFADHVSTSGMFYYPHPVTGEPTLVRFKEDPVFEYVGVNWKMTMHIKEV